MNKQPGQLSLCAALDSMTISGSEEGEEKKTSSETEASASEKTGKFKRLFAGRRRPNRGGGGGGGYGGGHQMAGGHPMGQPMGGHPMQGGHPMAGQPMAGGHHAVLPQARAQPIAIPHQVAAMPVAMTGFVQLVPHTVLDAIAMTNALMVIQCIEPLEILTGIETPNRYVVHDMYLRPMIYCFEQCNFMEAQFAGNDRNFKMEMVDLFGAPFMNAYRDKPCCSCSDYLATQFMGQQIGLMKKDGCSPDFQLFGTGCNQPLIVRTPNCVGCGGTCVFPVLTYNGQKVGEIVRLYPGYLQEHFTDADTYIVSFPMDLHPILKLLLISSTFLIDFTYFETDANGY